MDFFNIIADNGFYSKADRLKFYLEEQLFKGIDFKGKSVIDIGGGRGTFGYYAAIKGASKVVIMEPEFDGSSIGMIRDFKKINDLLGGLTNITLTTDVLEEYDRTNNQFDYILMHNSINHIDEEACIVLKEENSAQEKYLSFFKLLQEISNPEAMLLVCDCARSNLFGDVKMKNPFAKTIEWEKHQNPKFWATLLEKAGYSLESIDWTTPNSLGSVGNILFANNFFSYLTLSHFRMVLKNNAN